LRALFTVIRLDMNDHCITWADGAVCWESEEKKMYLLLS